MTENGCDYMDIDDEYILQDITSQIVEFRKENVLETYYKSSLTTQEPIIEQVLGKIKQISVIVVDTNFLISHLAFLKTLIYEHAKKYNFLIIVPWIVLQELDGLKSARWKNETSSSQHEVGNLAQNAIKFLHNCLVDKEEGLRGQKIDEKIEFNENNDDKILDCCRYFQMTTQRPIILLSNDKNLCVKAMVHGIITASYQKSEGLDSILKKILSKEKLNTDPLLNNGWEPISNETSTITLHKYDNDDDIKLGTENFDQDADTMMMDYDELPPDSSSSTQNQVSMYEAQMQNPSMPSAMVSCSPILTHKLHYPENSSLCDSIHAPKNKRSSNSVSSITAYETITYSEQKYNGPISLSLDDSIHSPRNIKRSTNNQNNPELVSHGVTPQILNDNKCDQIESIEILMMNEEAPHFPESILSRQIESFQESFVIKIIANLNNLLPPAISYHFQQCFGDDWTFVIPAQPWSLFTMLKFMDRYWFTVFSDVFQGIKRIRIETISNMISFISIWDKYEHNRKMNFTIKDIMQFLKNSEIVFRMIYDGVKWNNELMIETKQVAKNWWREFESSLNIIS
ncbi:3090_t:CDS:2 [Funneliformis geosporum]|uniref:11621_t:CDS:1 n=1 Tax=Funneliformis geosporum TaxID=1117311 RepID=A0A9W4WN01_9GLOM|nr:3090_t:CDS:2 [Funneliformis geosporum]CAI2166049.1 11621_t:CDS:2 [Funneliformis geosporum]